MRLTMVLCDAAQSVEGKLYIMGGGWTHVLESPQLSLAIAAVIAVPWEDANRRHSISVVLKDEDGNDVAVESPTGLLQAVRNDGMFEIGRPPGVKAGSDLNATMVFKFFGLKLEPGGYVWELTVGDSSERTPFWVIGGDS